MNQQIKVSDVNDIIKEKIAENRAKIDKLNDVEGMIPKPLIEEKQSIILDIIFAFQEVQCEVLSLVKIGKLLSDEELDANAKAGEIATRLSIVGDIHLDNTQRCETPEQKARDLLDRMEVEGAQDYTSGELVELANLFVE